MGTSIFGWFMTFVMLGIASSLTYVVDRTEQNVKRVVMITKRGRNTSGTSTFIS